MNNVDCITNQKSKKYGLCVYNKGKCMRVFLEISITYAYNTLVWLKKPFLLYFLMYSRFISNLCKSQYLQKCVAC